ncbi:SDR family NAD(P)-dependent oxidoreductase [Novispirillum sp. DQ9]|uniref:SDR family NAD(P)-dependent oxidoreductase n=1 Tax=Novispirillum sp. DQ9 TaxID=3398612 RepID=UPI003C7CDFF1
MRSVLITGASSGIGAALAREYAAPGVRLALCGRDAVRLEEVAAACRATGAEVAACVLSVTDAEAVAAWVAEADAAAPLDLVVANAGISAGTGDGSESAEQTRAIFAVNVDGVLNTVLPALAPMRARRRGQVAIVASVAGFRGLPSAPAYCASKAAVKAWGEGLRGWLAGDGVRVSVILPGFVESRITAANRFRMPFLMPAEKAARLIRRGLERDRGRIAFPWPTVFGAWLLSVLPDALADRLTRGLPGK